MGLTSIWHWIVLLIIVFAVFGTKKIRNIGRDLGGAVHDFKEGLNQGTQNTQNNSDNQNNQNNQENQDNKSV